MQPDRMTVKTQEALAAAQRLAQTRRNSQVSPAHLLVALLEQDGESDMVVLALVPCSLSRLRGAREPFFLPVMFVDDGIASYVIIQPGWYEVRTRGRDFRFQVDLADLGMK